MDVYGISIWLNCGGIMLKALPLPAVEELRRLFLWSPCSRVLRWRVSRRRGRSDGCVAGSPNPSGHWAVTIDRKKWFVHRLIWKLAYGVDPGRDCLDHLDGDPGNNSVWNLREVWEFENAINRPSLRAWLDYGDAVKVRSWMECDD